MAKYNPKDLLKKGKEVSLKLGKIVSQKDIQRFICSRDSIYAAFGSIPAFKKDLLNEYPELEALEVPVKITDKDIETYRLNLHGKSIKKNNQSLVQGASNLDYIAQFAEELFVNKITPVKPYVSKTKTERALNIVISDIHIGSDVKSEETGVDNYGKIEESRRLAAVVKEVIDYKHQYRAETELNVLLIGDLIQNQLHDDRDGAPLAEQIIRAIHLLSQALLQFSANFKKVNVHCVSGNHGRSMARHKSRAVNQKWDSHETVIAYALKTALKPQKNVTFYIPKTPYGAYEVFGQKVLYTHGDTFINPGYVGSVINTKSLEGQINKINASLNDNKEYKVFVMGHLHIASQTYLSNGATLITNGALISPDEYAVSIGVTESQIGQMLFESTPNYAVGDVRYIRVGSKEDKDKSLDSIITPWTNLND